MRFIDLTEGVINKATDEDISPETIADIVNKNCSEFLLESKGQALYRGVNIGGENLSFRDIFIEASPFLDRLPTNTGLETHEFAVKIMKDKGFKAHRGNSFFCSGVYGVAAEYGTVYHIFPKDGFKYTWSKNIDDFYYHVKKTNASSEEYLEDEEFYAGIESVIEKYQTDGLLNAIHSGHEVMVTCSSAYFIEDDEFDANLGVSNSRLVVNV